MARNLRFVITRGEAGKVLWFKLEPTNVEGEPEAQDISNWVVTMTVTRGGAVIIQDAECVAAVNQVTNIGEGTYTFDVDTADLAPGEYRLRFKAIDLGGTVYYFPTLPNRTYATLQVLAV